MDDAKANARPGIVGKTGPGAPPSHTLPWWGANIFRTRPPGPNNAGLMANRGPLSNLRFIPPLALFNDASQWVQRLYAVRPMGVQQTPNSNPPLTAQYFTPPPIQVKSTAANTLNLQLQQGALAIQASRLTQEDSNYFGN